MKRICFVLKVRVDKLQEYRKAHAAVWPEMLTALREAGWTSYSLFLREDGLLVGYFETEDFEHARNSLRMKEVNSRWQTEMTPLFEGLPVAHPDEAMQLLAEIFHLS